MAANPILTPNISVDNLSLLRRYVRIVRRATKAMQWADASSPDTRPDNLTAALRLADAVRPAVHSTLALLLRPDTPPRDVSRFWLITEIAKEVYTLSVLRSCDYAAYLASEHWQITRAFALDHAGHRCQVCNSDERPEVHHRTYLRRGAELPQDLIVLCRKCHETFHKNGRLAR